MFFFPEFYCWSEDDFFSKSEGLLHVRRRVLCGDFVEYVVSAEVYKIIYCRVYINFALFLYISFVAINSLLPVVLYLYTMALR